MFTDIVENRLDIAKQLGADVTYLVQKGRSESDTAADIHAIFGDEPDRTIDASGAESSIRLAILVCSQKNMYLYKYYFQLSL